VRLRLSSLLGTTSLPVSCGVGFENLVLILFWNLQKGKSMPKKVLVALPPGLLEQIDFVAQVEHRTRSDLMREALRRYIDAFKRNQGPRMQVSSVGSQKIALLTDAE